MPNSRNTGKNKPRKRVVKPVNSYSQKRYEGCGNVFKDMGKSNEEANNLFLRSYLMIAIEDIIRKQGWTQEKAAKIIGIARPQITELLASRIDLFGLDTLIKYLNRLGKQVSLTITDSEVA